MLLGVNIDHIATLRNARGGSEPGVIRAAEICRKVGVNGVTVHLREDRRHIKDDDLEQLINMPNLRVNLEMAATDEMQKIALKFLPAACCIVPENRQELTTEGGLDVAGQKVRISSFVEPLVKAGILVSLFIDPDETQVNAAMSTSAQYIELHTGGYANSFGTNLEDFEFERLVNAAKLAKDFGLRVNAGHGLDYKNVKRILQINQLEELNIGHSIVAKSVFDGFENAVREMKEMIT